MLQSPTTRKPSAAAVDAASEVQRRRKLFLAMIILFATLIVILVRDTQLWFSNDAPVAEDDTYVAPSAPVSQSASASTSAVQTLPAPVVKATKHVAVAKPSPEQPEPPIVATNRTPLPPLGIQVVAGDSGRNIHLSTNSSGVNNSARIVSTPASTPQLTKVSQRTTVASSAAQAPDQTVVAEYPLLARQMKVQGSVLMQALIAANGVIEDLRVISGPAILAAAARQAVMQYHFKPYLHNGQPVETSARVTVNFAIRVVGDQTALRIGGGSTSGGD